MEAKDTSKNKPSTPRRSSTRKKATSENGEKVKAHDNRLPRPDEIKAALDKYVIGQESAKKILSVAAYNHYKRCIMSLTFPELGIEKSNIILLGPTGCGKTLMVRTLAKILEVPCYIQDCTKLTASGYVGSDVEDCLSGLLRTCDYDLQKAEMGIVYLDEGDKIAKKGDNLSITRDVSGECVQQSLLKIVEGDVVGVQPQNIRKNPMQECIHINTKNILFILSGAFVGLSDIIKHRLGHKSIGFGSQPTKASISCGENILQYTTSDDLKKFGLIPEFIGRFPIVTNVEELDKDSLVRILTEPKTSIIQQYTAMLDWDKIDVNFENDALDYIAELALATKTGARGLRAIVETVMNDIMFEAPKIAFDNNWQRTPITIGKQLVIDKTYKKFSQYISA